MPWKIYLWVLVALEASFLVAELFARLFQIDALMEWLLIDQEDSWGLIVYILNLVPLVGLYGFVYRKKIISAFLWKVVFISYSIYLLQGYFEFKDFDLSLFEGGLLIVALMILGIPVAVANYFYGFRSKEIW